MDIMASVVVIPNPSNVLPPKRNSIEYFIHITKRISKSEYILQKKVKELLTFTSVLKFRHRFLDFIERSEMLLSPNKSRNPPEM
jgi:hypothetical protein